MKSLLLALLVLPGFIQGQDSIASGGKRFYLGLSASPDYGDVHLTRKSSHIPLSEKPWEVYKNYLDTFLQADFGYTVGLSAYYNLKGNFSMETGIQFSRKSYHSVAYPGTIGFGEDTTLVMLDFNFNYLELPLRVNYTFLDSKFQVVVSAGMIFHYLLQANQQAVYEYSQSSIETVKTVTTEHSNSYVISSTISCGVVYNISSNMNIRAEPTFRYGHINVDRKVREFSHLWSAGLNLGIYCSL